jgi:hypothetical protein
MKELHQLPVPPSCENVTFRLPAAIRSRGWRSRKDTYPRLLRCIEKPGLNFQIGKERFVVAEAFQVVDVPLGRIQGRPNVWGKRLVIYVQARLAQEWGKGTSVSVPWCPDHWTTALEDSRIPFYL